MTTRKEPAASPDDGHAAVGDGMEGTEHSPTIPEPVEGSAVGADDPSTRSVPRPADAALVKTPTPSSAEASERSSSGIVPGVSRRGLFLGTGAGALAGLAIGAGVTTALRPAAEATPPAAGLPVPAAGANQAGIGRPVDPQSHNLVVVATLDPAAARATLAGLGERILRLTDPEARDVLMDGPGDLTVQVGVGPRVLARNPAVAGLADMPLYTGDAELPAVALGGDLLLMIQASNPGVLEPVFEALVAPGSGITVQWREHGARGPSQDMIARNPLGFHDGIINPRGEDEYAEQVWIPDGPLAGGTICAIRRFVLATREFSQLAPPRQDAVIGRERATGRPLSGGEMRDEADITARAANGDVIIPLRSHIRAAHPSFTDSGVMLRRSYGFTATGIGVEPANGLVFISYQNVVRTFVATQQRMDETDDLMDFARPTATAAFAILPGFDGQRPLGSTLGL